MVKQHGHKAPFRRYQPTASKSTYSAVTGEQVVLQWRPSAADRLVGLEVCCDDALCFVGRCGRAFENDRTCGW
jgi:hypothetical protein